MRLFLAELCRRRLAIGIALLSFLLWGVTVGNAAWTTEKIPALMYHHILPESENESFRDNAVTLSLEDFETQMKFLHEGSYKTLAAKDVEGYLCEGKALPQKAVWLTFDDGYESNLRYAYPILKKYNLHGTIFTVTSYVHLGEAASWNPQKAEYLNAVEMVECADVFDFASHSHNMHREANGRPVVESLTKDEIRSDLKYSLTFPYLTDKVCYSYPYGTRTPEILQTLRELGVKIAVTATEGYITPKSNPYELKRFNIFRGISQKRFEQIVTCRLRK